MIHTWVLLVTQRRQEPHTATYRQYKEVRPWLEANLQCISLHTTESALYPLCQTGLKTVTEKRLKHPKWSIFSFYFIQGSVFWPAKFESDVHFRRVQKTPIIRKILFFRIIENITYGGRVCSRQPAMGLQDIRNFPAAKRLELINFSRTKRSFGRSDSADCKQCGMKWSAEGADRVAPQPASRKPCRRIWSIKKQR